MDQEIDQQLKRCWKKSVVAALHSNKSRTLRKHVCDYIISDEKSTNSTGVTIRFYNKTMGITIHGRHYVTSQWYGLIYSTIQWLQIDMLMFFPAKKRGKENANVCTVLEEVKHWKSSIHWTTQTFSWKPWFNLCGAQTPAENLSFFWCFAATIHHYQKRRCWCNTHVQSVRKWTGLTLTTIY